MRRQNFRKLLLISSLLLFPITIYYLSPYLIIQGAIEGVITGSFIVFISMLIASIFLGRLFCGYLCPAGGLQECAELINNKDPKQGWKNNIKYIIWTLWVLSIVACFIFKHQVIKVDFFFMTDHGISIANIYGYIIYYGVVLLIFVPSVIFGKRIFCHYFCWMAPFMVLGRKLGNLLHVQALGLEGDKKSCINCYICDKNCQMSLKVSEMVQRENMEHSECILCGACVDSCPKKAITYKIKGVGGNEKNKIRAAGASSGGRA